LSAARSGFASRLRLVSLSYRNVAQHPNRFSWRVPETAMAHASALRSGSRERYPEYEWPRSGPRKRLQTDCMARSYPFTGEQFRPCTPFACLLAGVAKFERDVLNYMRHAERQIPLAEFGKCFRQVRWRPRKYAEMSSSVVAITTEVDRKTGLGKSAIIATSVRRGGRGRRNSSDYHMTNTTVRRSVNR